MKKKSCTRAWCGVLGGGISGNFHIIGYARRGSKGAKAQQKNDNFARWGKKTAQSEKFKEKAEGKVEIQ